MILYPWLQRTFTDIGKRISHQQLHHGLLFVADKGAGEAELLNNIAQALLCEKINNHPKNSLAEGHSEQRIVACGKCKSCMLFQAQSHPDVKKLVTDKPSIGVDLIRSVSEFVTTTSQLLGNKVVIIDDIHLMTEAASNSLLKTLEEPSNNTYILLSTYLPAKLLATIMSRCEKVRVKLPSHAEAMAWLQSQTQTPISIDGLKAYADSPLEYLAALKDSSHGFVEFQKDIQELQAQRVSALSLANKWQSDPALVLRWTYQWCVGKYQLIIKAEPHELLKNKDETYKIEKCIERCQQANLKINQAGINKSLLLQQVFNTVFTPTH